MKSIKLIDALWSLQSIAFQFESGLLNITTDSNGRMTSATSLVLEEEEKLRKFLNSRAISRRAASPEPKSTLREKILSRVEVDEKFWVNESDYKHNRDGTWNLRDFSGEENFQCKTSAGLLWHWKNDMVVFVESMEK